VIRRNVARAFAGAGKVVYGKAFDALKVTGDAEISWDDLGAVEANLDHIVLYEIKSTKKHGLASDFNGYFFSLSTAELLVAQSLGPQFKFAFINVNAPEAVRERTLEQLFRQTTRIYPTWSIRLGAPPPGDP
jgi:hypothetical protein